MTPPVLVYQFKVHLLHVSPMIWRRFTVPASLTLDQFHEVLQAVMGWENIHLHTFELQGCAYGGGAGDTDAALDHFQLRPTEKMLYIYDYSQFPVSTSWQHEIRLERILEDVPQVKQLRCLAGQRRGPPEDLGGPEGYEDWRLSRYAAEHFRPISRMFEIVKALRDSPDDKIVDIVDVDEVQDLMDRMEDWLEEDPEAFSVKEVNHQLRALQKEWAEP